MTATVVDTSGLVRVQLKGDGSVVHTGDTAFRKAYTVVSLGPVFGFDRSSAFVELVARTPGAAGASLTTLPNVIAPAGGVAIKPGVETVAGLVSGVLPAATRMKPAQRRAFRQSPAGCARR